MRADDRAIDDKIRMPLFVFFGRPMVCALSALGLGRSVVIYVKGPSLSPVELKHNTATSSAFDERLTSTVLQSHRFTFDGDYLRVMGTYRRNRRVFQPLDGKLVHKVLNNARHCKNYRHINKLGTNIERKAQSSIISTTKVAK
jgi:hypothetical protein